MDPRAVRPGWPASFVMLLSGASTLVLEIVWVRQLGLALGRTHAALSTVTAAFLAGLAGGAYLSVRSSRPRATLIQAHLAAGTLGVLFPALVGALESTLTALSTVTGGGTLFTLVSHSLAGILVLIPAMLLGSALPLVLRLRTESRAGWFSALSAAGAAAGSLATGFLFLPSLGNAATARLGALIALLAAAFAAFLPSESTEAPADVREPAARCAMPVAVAVAVVCFSAVGMLLELSFIRYFTLILGSTTFAISLILAAFILGSSAGSLTADRVLSFARARNLTAANGPGVSAVLAGVAIIALIPLLGRLPVWMVSLHTSPWSFEAQQLALFAVTTLTMLVPAMALGAVFPFAVATVPRRSGALIAASTTGSVAGTLAWGAFVLPALGLQRTLVACALALIGSGTAWCSGRLAGAAVTALALLAVQAFLPVWKPHVMAAGVHHYANVYAERARQLECTTDKALESFGRILAYRDGPDGSVAVRQQADGTRSLVIDGKADASTMGDMRTQRLLGHLPALLGPGRRALVIGLGSGVTAGSLLSYGFERVDVVELSREVVQYSPFFSADSRAPLADPRTHVVVQDARALLARTDARWDVITSEPTNPWVAGAAALFTQEFFAQCRATMNPEGLMCQWVPAYHQSPDEFRAIVAGFTRTFPHVTLWESTRGLDYLLIGSAKPLQIPMDRLRAAFFDRVIANDLAEVEIRDPEDLLSRFVCGPRASRRSRWAWCRPPTIASSSSSPARAAAALPTARATSRAAWRASRAT